MNNIKGFAKIHDGNIHLVSLHGRSYHDKTQTLGFARPPGTKTMLVVHQDITVVKMV
ncbi:hypothetical protein DPMN_144340 [Dreissena polymorpha]|uniref:Uncharacterized protein n=1 Tax=Dreissena polymorpha TaxID=45954 RepID=A0A9D4JMG9_DREPO|nr:hypothetical protein DPMN_144340 [Dreissena polymorpha]